MSTIEVGEIRQSKNNISDRTEIRQEYYYTGEKEIKYITFFYLAYNRVNDIVSCQVSRETEIPVKLIGPIAAKNNGYVDCKKMWYNPTITKISISKIYIQYMDNTEELINSQDILSIFDEKSCYYSEIAIPRKEAWERSELLSKLLDENAKILWGEDSENSISKESEILNACSKVFFNLKDYEGTLRGVIEKIIGYLGCYYCYKTNFIKGYIIGDYIEKEYADDEKLMRKARVLWKFGIKLHNKYIKDKSFFYKIKQRKTIKRYADKIVKYEPDYVIPKIE